MYIDVFWLYFHQKKCRCFNCDKCTQTSIALADPRFSLIYYNAYAICSTKFGQADGIGIRFTFHANIHMYLGPAVSYHEEPHSRLPLEGAEGQMAIVKGTIIPFI